MVELIKVPTVVRLFAGDVLICEVESAELFSFVLQHVTHNKALNAATQKPQEPRHD